MIADNFFAVSQRLGLSRRDMAAVVGLGCAQALSEAGAVMLLLLALQYIQAVGRLEHLVEAHASWRVLASVYAGLGVPVSLATVLLLAYLAVLVRQSMQFLQRVVTSRKRWDLTAKIKARLFRAFMSADLGAVENEGTGRMLAEFTSETETAVTALFYSMQAIILIGIFCVYFGGLLMLSVSLTLLAAAIMGGTALLLRPLVRRSLSIGATVSQANQDIGTFLVERLRQLRLVRLAGMETAEFSTAQRLLARQGAGQVSGETLAVRISSTIEPVFVGLAFFCLWFGAARLHLGLEYLGVFLVIVMRLVPIGKDFMGARQIILQTAPALGLVDQTLSRLTAARESQGGSTAFPKKSPTIRFESVSFSYNGRENTLDNINLTLPAGRITSLVGPSGAGKSTLIDLLPILRRPQSGKVTFDGVEAREYALSSLRNAVAYIPQQPQLFDGTIADHVRYGQAGASDDEVREALKLAQCEFVERLPEGIATRIGEGGGRLSGGQRQRIELARALVRKAQIVVMDEPTSALDAENERHFLAAVEAVRRSRAPTMLIIAHRLSTVAAADQIVVIEAGKIIESGTHSELVVRAGWYAKAWAMQSERPNVERAQARP